ncbi:MAG TPA: phosphate ABC transporter substrate-binding protein [Eubacteriales bacterium]|nr:phosphate ABC transporter substrate-binding protein [Eubacteriales bacterium]
MKKIIAIAIAVLLCVSMFACTSTSEPAADASGAITGSVTAAGSSALLPLAQAAAEKFMESNPDCSVVVNGGGSGEGLKQVADGAVDIGNSDVFAEQKLDEAVAAGLTDHKVCTIAMAAVVNKDLGVTDLTTDQLISIFTAETTNWSEVGGPDLDILLVTRPSSSGTRALFKTWALNGTEEASNQSLETDDSGTLMETVQNNPGAIGYVALSYLVSNDTVQAVSINGVAPTLENMYNGTYLVWGYEHMYTNGAGSEAAQAFIDYMMSDEFAANIEAMGYGASSKLSDAAIATHETSTQTVSAATAEPTAAPITGSVTAAGSSALLPLAQAAADLFMESNPDCSVVVNGGGSGNGLKQVADNAVDIGNSDVFAEQKLDEAVAAGLTDHKVCTIAMAAVVNKDLGVTDLTTDQLISIFTAETTNWSEVGGPDLDILLVTRPSSSGTRALFKTWALNGTEEASNQSLETDDSGTLMETVQNNPGAIGYVALSYLVNNDNVQAVSINGVAPTLENMYNGTYLVWGYEHMYTNGAGSEAAQAFIAYMMSDEFAEHIEAMGYGASSKLSADAIASHE